ncbi:hypothetical protein [Ruegeria sp.]|uniref:hypothetical protein n=1 Tax=Ruegeria sp. TaxID=1879320 RepID=UPI003C7E612E
MMGPKQEAQGALFNEIRPFSANNWTLACTEAVLTTVRIRPEQPGSTQYRAQDQPVFAKWRYQ